MPTFSDVVLQIHCDGSDGSTTITDVSLSALTVTAANGAALSTAQSKWGGASLLLETKPSPYENLTIASTPAFGFGSGAWTAEAWIRPSEIGITHLNVFDFRSGTATDHASIYIVLSGGTRYYGGGILRGIDGPSAIVANVWHHVAWCYDGTTLRYFLNGVLQWSESFTPNFSTARSLYIGSSYTQGGNAYKGYIDDIRVTNGAWYTTDFSPPTAPFEVVTDAVGRIEANAVLSIPSIFVASGLFGIAAVPIIVGTASILAKTPIVGFIESSNIFSPASLLAHYDFTNKIDSAVPIIYYMDLVTPGGLVRVPISSWQATLQTDVQSYVQCVVPAATAWVPDIEAATEFLITRRGALLDGREIEYEMARAPAQTVSLDGGAYNYTATLSGYTAPLNAVENPPTALDRTLTGVRTVSRNSGNVRVRCNIDWLLRPGQRAYLEDEPIVVSYVNYYVPGFDQYMDVGDRAA